MFFCCFVQRAHSLVPEMHSQPSQVHITQHQLPVLPSCCFALFLALSEGEDISFNKNIPPLETMHLGAAAFVMRLPLVAHFLLSIPIPPHSKPRCSWQTPPSGDALLYGTHLS